MWMGGLSFPISSSLQAVMTKMHVVQETVAEKAFVLETCGYNVMTRIFAPWIRATVLQACVKV